MRMHYVLIILALTFIQGHTDLNGETNKCSIILETVQAMVCHVCCEDSPTKGLYFLSSINLPFIQGPDCWALKTKLSINYLSQT